ncbi:hypothetical protein [Halosimplex salinum]|uniref:hypothetical protein n=1 Tax=Halosimplex salinum TaxID=1710538 RepID=UPI000F483F7D|nr:hypothetical protein [Halosimplex salinum]
MQVVCKDGTSIQCTDFEALDSGVLLYQDTGRRETRTDDEEEEESEERRATGFVPITELRFVVPDEMVQTGGPGSRAATPEPGRGGAPPSPPAGPQGQMAQQQQAQQFPGGPAQNPYDTGGQ